MKSFEESSLLGGWAAAPRDVSFQSFAIGFGHGHGLKNSKEQEDQP